MLRTKCPICCRINNDNQIKFHRDFSPMAAVVPFSRYNVYKCAQCNFVYAGDIEESLGAEKYYKSMSRYEGDNFVLSLVNIELYNNIADFIEKNVQKNTSIIDIGCAFGGLLNVLKSRGYTKLSGIEPSHKNSEYARAHYGIDVIVGELRKETVFERKYDLIILSGVLEHLVDFRDCIQACISNLSENGLILVVVPNLSSFWRHEDLYQEFSIEHINYFSIDSLNMLFKTFGLTYYDSTYDDLNIMGLSGNLFGLYGRKTTVRDEKSTGQCGSEKELMWYINRCDRFANTIKNNLLRIIDSNQYKEFYIWGAGTQTAMMYQAKMFENMTIKGIVDANPKYKNKVLFNHKIMSPEDICEDYPIIISSQYAFKEIENAIKNRLKLTNSIINIYE